VTESSPPTLAAIVPATDGPETLDRCLAAIRASEGAPEEVIAVTESPGTGAAAARNAGAARARAEVLVFVDADVLVHPDAFTRIRRAFADDPELTAIFGAYDDSPEATDPVSAFRNLLHHHVHQAGAGRASTFWTGLGAIRAERFDAAGGFDEQLFSEPVASVEDIELGMRLAAQGARIELDPGLQGTHLKRWTVGEMVRVDFSRRGVPWVALLLRQRELSANGAAGAPAAGTTLNLGWRHRLSALACLLGAVALLRRRPAAALLALLALVGLNRSFYALLMRRGGIQLAGPSVGLHAVHHLTGLSSIPPGIALYLRWQRRPADIEA
jgi:hypothetical protein